MSTQLSMAEVSPEPLKFSDPAYTADGSRRAHVALKRLTTLWFNTGTLCNIECANCYIKSSPKNDSLVYLRADEVAAFLNEIEGGDFGTQEIGFTGGEPFMNPDMLSILEDTLSRGFEALVLTNAMRPMMRPRIQEGLLALREKYGEKLHMRVSLDHYREALHDEQRGKKNWSEVVKGIDWLSGNGFRLDIAGRTLWNEGEENMRKGYGSLSAERGWQIDCTDPSRLVLFPEMEEGDDTPEITEACWDILGKRPEDIMCASSRMVVKRKGAEKPVVLSCTLLAYDERFEMGETLAEANAFGPVSLNHPHCSKFCVLGGGSCSRTE